MCALGEESKVVWIEAGSHFLGVTVKHMGLLNLLARGTCFQVAQGQRWSVHLAGSYVKWPNLRFSKRDTVALWDYHSRQWLVEGESMGITGQLEQASRPSEVTLGSG